MLLIPAGMRIPGPWPKRVVVAGLVEPVCTAATVATAITLVVSVAAITRSLL